MTFTHLDSPKAHSWGICTSTFNWHMLVSKRKKISSFSHTSDCFLLSCRKTDWQNLPVEQQNILYEFGQALATVGIVSLGLWFSSQLNFVNW